jgi:hypothetical protein
VHGVTASSSYAGLVAARATLLVPGLLLWGTSFQRFHSKKKGPKMPAVGMCWQILGVYCGADVSS